MEIVVCNLLAIQFKQFASIAIVILQTCSHFPAKSRLLRWCKRSVPKIYLENVFMCVDVTSSFMNTVMGVVNLGKLKSGFCQNNAMEEIYA